MGVLMVNHIWLPNQKDRSFRTFSNDSEMLMGEQYKNFKNIPLLIPHLYRKVVDNKGSSCELLRRGNNFLCTVPLVLQIAQYFQLLVKVTKGMFSIPLTIGFIAKYFPIKKQGPIQQLFSFTVY